MSQLVQSLLTNSFTCHVIYLSCALAHTHYHGGGGGWVHRVVLEAVPLQLDKDNLSLDFPRSWILPVLKDHVRETELCYFTEVMLPLAVMLRQRGQCTFFFFLSKIFIL